MKYSLTIALSILLSANAQASDLVHFTCSSRQAPGPKTAVLTLLPTVPSFRVHLAGAYMGQARTSADVIELDNDDDDKDTFHSVTFAAKDASRLQIESVKWASGWFGSRRIVSRVDWDCKAASADKAKLPILKKIESTLLAMIESWNADHSGPAPSDSGSSSSPPSDWGNSCSMSSDCSGFCNNGQCT